MENVFVRHSVLSKSGLVCGSLVVALLVIEVTFRIIGYDLLAQQEKLDNIPVYFKMPTVQMDNGLFRREGPLRWRGRPLFTRYKQQFAGANPYTDEAEVTITYDRDGFRNPADLADWDVVVAGDSFTEQGCLADEDIFTARLGRKLGLRVKNLGVSYTGPLTQTTYLARYGKAKSTRQAILVFFEGNDIDDLRRENAQLKQRRETGDAPRREVTKQTSFIIALYTLAHNWYIDRVGKKRMEAARTAYFESNNGAIPVTLDLVPPSRTELTQEDLALLDQALSDWAATSRQLGLTPWLAYMPAKLRALYGSHLKLTPKTSQQYQKWQPTDLPQLVQEVAARHEIKFIDLTPVLQKASERGDMTYNPIWDTHLNSKGALVVANVLATAISQ